MYILKGMSLQLFGHFRQKTKKCHKFLKLLSKIAKIHAWYTMLHYNGIKRPLFHANFHRDKI